MKAMTLTNPWCGLVASGIKLIENRPRKIVKQADFGKPFALHASREIDDAVYSRIRTIAPELDTDSEWYRLSRVTSAVIAVATIDRELYGWTEDGIREHEATLRMQLGDQYRWLFGPVGYVLRDVRALPAPVPCKGALGFWTLPEDIERKVLDQLVIG